MKRIVISRVGTGISDPGYSCFVLLDHFLRVHQLFDALSRLYERAGDLERAIDTVNRWLSYDPLHEEGYRCLMSLRFSLGDRIGALRAYAICREVLAHELELEPEPETVALATRIRCTAPVRLTRTRSFGPLDPSPGQSASDLLDGPYLGRSTEFGTLIDCYRRVHAGQSHFHLGVRTTVAIKCLGRMWLVWTDYTADMYGRCVDVGQRRSWDGHFSGNASLRSSLPT